MKLNLESCHIPDKLRIWRDEQDRKQKAHVGTHIDTYCNTLDSKGDIILRGVIVDVRGVIEIGSESLQGKDVPEEGFVIFRTGYMERYGYGSDGYFQKEGAPYLKDELIDDLIKRGVRFIGIDLHGVQHGANHKRIDVYCEERGVYIVENLINLEKSGSSPDLRVRWEGSEGASAIPVEIEVD